MKRRRFVIVLSVLFLSVVLFVIVKYYRKLTTPPLANPELLSLILDYKTIRTIGGKYRTKFPKEDNERMLTSYLTGNLDFQISGSSLSTRILKDFEEGKIVIIDGWVLSVTEARQCALFSMLN
jgi:hypothetical protein